MTEAIATLALLTSIMLLIVHYKNQIERRHGEIAHLRSVFLKRLASVQQRIVSIQMHSETMRIELRRLQDSDEKYESIEEMPKLIDGIHGLVQGVNKLKDKLNNMDTTKSNKSKVLLVLQSLDNDIQSFEDNTSSIEKATLRLLEHIRTIQEKEKKMD